jgi:adenosylcobinamide-GDP ribazoletransferase
LYVRRRLGGYTGDSMGAAQQLMELGFYLGAIAGLSQGRGAGE